MKAGVRAGVIWLRQDAPHKPAAGEACNGCGACCAAETCPVARVFLLQWRGPCRALTWQEEGSRYVCGMLTEPATYLPLPAVLVSLMRRLVHRWIAADTACDFAAELRDQNG